MNVRDDECLLCNEYAEHAVTDDELTCDCLNLGAPENQVVHRIRIYNN